jgi:hypothetical protein
LAEGGPREPALALPLLAVGQHEPSAEQEVGPVEQATLPVVAVAVDQDVLDALGLGEQINRTAEHRQPDNRAVRPLRARA